MKRYAILAVAATMALGACTATTTTTMPAIPATATTPLQPAVATTTTTIQTPLDKIVAFLASPRAIKELQATLADAQTRKDVVAAQCYAGLIPIAEQLQKQSAGVTVPGDIPAPHPILDFQVIRDTKGQLASATLAQLRTQINLACGALYVDTNAGVIDPLSVFSGQ